MSDIKVIRFNPRKLDTLLHIEAEGVTVNIRVGLHDAQHRPVTHVEVIADASSGNDWSMPDHGNEKYVAVRTVKGYAVPRQPTPEESDWRQLLLRIDSSIKDGNFGTLDLDIADLDLAEAYNNYRLHSQAANLRFHNQCFAFPDYDTESDEETAVEQQIERLWQVCLLRIRLAWLTLVQAVLNAAVREFLPKKS